MSLDKWQSIVKMQKKLIWSAEYDQLSWSHQQLKKLRQMIEENEDDLLQALNQDLGKSKFEAYASEIAVTLNEIDYLLKTSKKALRAKKVLSKPGTKVFVKRKPYGSILIISPWNYPVQLSLLPLAGALACGNRCFLKPSEQAVSTSRLLTELIEKYFDENTVTSVEGDAKTAADLLSLDWDFIFFTGSESVGDIIAKAAARLRIPSVLELGGKCPCIVDSESVNLATVKNITWGKFFNAGQTCIAPDYLLLPEKSLDKFLYIIKNQIHLMYGANPQNSPDYGRIINEKHTNRLLSYLKMGTIKHGGSFDIENRYIEPTIIIEPEGALLQEEIFGPILPIITYRNYDEIIEIVRKTPTPLSVYAFCKDKQLIKTLETELPSGSFCLNQVLQQAASPKIPFGGVGNSGYGSYHGKASLDVFSYQKTLSYNSLRFDLKAKYPPYKIKYINLMKKFRKMLP